MTHRDAPEAIPRAAPTTADSTLRSTRGQERVLDVVTVVVLSVVAIATAWCGFESSKWSGEMSIAFSQASSARIQASNADAAARDARQYDLSIYIQWVLAENRNDDQLVAFIEERFTPEFRAAFDAWEAGGRDAQGPFVVDEYVPAGTERAEELSAQADAKFEQALVNNARGDGYSLLTVLFALVLFFTAISQRDVALWIRRTFLGFGIVIGTVCIGIMLSYPIII